MKKSILPLLIISLVLSVFVTCSGQDDINISDLIGVPLSELAGFRMSGDKIALDHIGLKSLGSFKPDGSAKIIKSSGGAGEGSLYKSWENDQLKLAVSITRTDFSLNFELLKDSPMKLEVKSTEGSISLMIVNDSADTYATMKQDIDGAVEVTLGKSENSKSYSGANFADFRKKYPAPCSTLLQLMKNCKLLLPGSGLDTDNEEVELEPGELLLFLADGSRVKGRVDMKEWVLKTAYGKLVIPSPEITAIGLDSTLTGEDEVATIRFDAPGILQFDELVVETKLGSLTIPKSDIREIHFPNPRLEEQFELKPGDDWINTGLVARRHDKLEIKSETLDDGFKLKCRIDDEEFDVGPGFSMAVLKEGMVFLRLEPADDSTETAAKYPVKVILQK